MVMQCTNPFSELIYYYIGQSENYYQKNYSFFKKNKKKSANN